MSPVNNPPLVSVICTVFNHASFLRNCLDGFIMQQTCFPIEVLINDDASTDDSASIIREYENNYPEIIKPIYQVQNQYSRGVNLWSLLFSKATGKYIAICEGDDYWTDPHKLQKQVDYMEAHPECSLCFHNAITHWYDNSKADTLFANVEERDYTGVELTETWYSPTASFLFRETVVEGFRDMFDKHPLIIVCDIPLVVQCAKEGVVHGLSEIMSVYGKHAGGWTSFHEAEKTFIDGRSWEERRLAFGEEYYKVTTDKMTGLYLNALFRAVKERNIIIAFKALYRGIIKQPITGIKALLRIPRERRERIQKEL